MSRLLTGEEFGILLRAASRSVFRLETLQTYRGSGEDEWIAAFHAGSPAPPPDPAQDDYEAIVAALRGRGGAWRRVHVVHEPLSDYVRYELAWAYALNVAAGEDIRIITTAPGKWPGGVPRLDFWLVDDTVYVPRYAADGTWLGTVEPPQVTWRTGVAHRWRAAAWQLGQPWAEWIAARPQLAARVPAA